MYNCFRKPTSHLTVEDHTKLKEMADEYNDMILNVKKPSGLAHMARCMLAHSLLYGDGIPQFGVENITLDSPNWRETMGFSVVSTL